MSKRYIRKSVLISTEDDRRIDDFRRGNPGITFSAVMTNALRAWFKDPVIRLELPENGSAQDFEIEEEEETPPVAKATTHVPRKVIRRPASG